MWAITGIAVFAGMVVGGFLLILLITPWAPILAAVLALAVAVIGGGAYMISRRRPAEEAREPQVSAAERRVLAEQGEHVPRESVR